MSEKQQAAVTDDMYSGHVVCDMLADK